MFAVNAGYNAVYNAVLLPLSGFFRSVIAVKVRGGRKGDFISDFGNHSVTSNLISPTVNVSPGFALIVHFAAS
jgi:hypothetical protein